MKVFSRQNVLTENFDKNFEAKFLPAIHFSRVRLTVVQNKTERCCAKTAKTLPIFTKARTEYSGRGTAMVTKQKFSCSL